jgi:serine/threonine protein kinase
VPAPAPEAKAVVAGAPEILEEYGNYFLLEKIAIGGMAELFKAQQRGVQGFQKIVAIKRILPHFSDNEDFVTMFIDEAKLAAQLTHPNIVQIFDLGKAGSSYYIAMEYVNGRDLRTLLRKVREHGLPFPEQVAAFVVMKVAAALDYAHRKRGFDDRELKLVHRDISPQNVILSTEGAVKLVDFGIAKAASKASHTVAGALKGKLLYMSPEQATGQPLDNRSDLYSLGLVLFELLTGERCFQADSELGVLEKVRLGRVSDLLSLNPKVSKEMAAIVNRALQKSVDHRYPSARFMERDLREYLQRQGTPVTEHDVAEYMQALLNATPENLEQLVATKFPPPATFTSGTHRNLGLPPETLVRMAAAPPEVSAPPEDHLEPIEPLPDTPPRPRWMLPVILGLAAVLVALLVIARWS